MVRAAWRRAAFGSLLEHPGPGAAHLRSGVVRAERVFQRADHEDFDGVFTAAHRVGHVDFPWLRNELPAELADVDWVKGLLTVGLHGMLDMIGNKCVQIISGAFASDGFGQWQAWKYRYAKFRERIQRAVLRVLVAAHSHVYTEENGPPFYDTTIIPLTRVKIRPIIPNAHFGPACHRH